MESAKFAGQFRQALDAGDAMQLWRIWAHVFPAMPAPKTLAEAEVIMHRARTEATSIAFKARAYSHAWLVDRGLPSGLPDELRPKAEQMRPRVVEAVGISVKMPAILKDVGMQVQRAMSDAVEELHADGVDLKNRPVVHGRMFEARDLTLKRLLG